MTETAQEWSIAEAISKAQRPRDELFELAGKAGRLQRSIKVAEKWMDAAAEGDPAGEMDTRAETIHGELEEELSRVAWEMEMVNERRREQAVDEERPEGERVEDVEAVACASRLSNLLTEAYTILAQLPQELLGLGGDEPSQRTRYRLMGHCWWRERRPTRN